MRTFSLALLPALLVPSVAAHAQAAPSTTASSVLTPALDNLRQSLSELRIDKWKAPGAVRQDANSNIGSINRDLDGTLPGLLKTADASPNSIAENLPVFRNVDALYDVLLRVVETADLSAPDEDTESLHHALTALEDARRNLGDMLEGAAVAQEKQLAALRAQLSAQAAAPKPPVATTTVDDGTAPAAKPTHKHRVVKPKTQTPPPAQ